MNEQRHRAKDDDQFVFGYEPAWRWRPFGADCGRIHANRLGANRRCSSIKSGGLMALKRRGLTSSKGLLDPPDLHRLLGAKA
jgi:hypothetical protein